MRWLVSTDVQAWHRDNYERLVKLKNKFDPENLLRSNQNIDPRSGGRP